MIRFGLGGAVQIGRKLFGGVPVRGGGDRATAAAAPFVAAAPAFAAPASAAPGPA
jgi:hypothetical protein